ncbi:MAG TPA: UbiD family decarboxylase [Flavipsychrobacter sp.]|nr:UbiD family decarboxylase [Flavipsychrobacter sp.]
MPYKSLEECLLDLEKNQMLIRVKEEVDPELEMAAIQLRVYEAQGPALLFERVKGTNYRAACNIFGTLDRSRFIFRDTFQLVQQLISLKNDPLKALKHPLQNFKAGLAGLKALPLRNPSLKPVMQNEVAISDFPLIRHWPRDGGAFITLPQVYSESVEKPGVMNANLGMYRIQLTGNDYKLNEEIGLHYQIHRGIGVHQSLANKKGQPLKVSIFVGGPPAHTLAAVMPLPEGLSELTFAGLLGGRRFRYTYADGYCISTDADFVITGEIYADETKPEGPFGDHLGYYSLTHSFPLMKVKKVYARNNAIWPFTVVGRPPQEDTSFGALIHELTGDAVPAEIPGLKEVNAVDAAGVHPLLLAVGSERYTPYSSDKKPAELLTIANHVLGTGQLSLAKYLLIAADEKNKVSTHNIEAFFQFVLERIDLRTDLHFQTNTTIDTLDYSGTGLNKGSKLIMAAHGDVKRTLCKEPPVALRELKRFENAQLIMPGVAALQTSGFTDYQAAIKEMEMLNDQLREKLDDINQTAIIVVCDDSSFVSERFNNFLWVTFTRSNPSHDVYGIRSFTKFKHWGCEGAMVIDARIKPHHAPPLELDPNVERKINRFFDKGGSLYGLLR